MEPALGEHTLVVDDDLSLDPERRSLAVELYLKRLARLVHLDAAADPGLSLEEQRRLRTRAVISAVETLTALGAGPSASDLLRAARHGRRYPAACMPRSDLLVAMERDAGPRGAAGGAAW